MRTSRLNREIVIECAMELVHESGINGLRLNKIAERLDVKSPSLYTHTGSITELRQAVVQQAMEQFREKLVDSLLGRADLYAFLELGKTWATYAKDYTAFYSAFYRAEYVELYDKNISVFLYAAFERVFSNYELSEKEVGQIERILTSYFRGYSDILIESNFDETELISDLAIIHSGVIHNKKPISQVV